MISCEPNIFEPNPNSSLNATFENRTNGLQSENNHNKLHTNNCLTNICTARLHTPNPPSASATPRIPPNKVETAEIIVWVLKSIFIISLALGTNDNESIIITNPINLSRGVSCGSEKKTLRDSAAKKRNQYKKKLAIILNQNTVSYSIAWHLALRINPVLKPLSIRVFEKAKNTIIIPNWPNSDGDSNRARMIPIKKDSPLPSKLSIKLQVTPLNDFSLSDGNIL